MKKLLLSLATICIASSAIAADGVKVLNQFEIGKASQQEVITYLEKAFSCRFKDVSGTGDEKAFTPRNSSCLPLPNVKDFSVWFWKDVFFRFEVSFKDPEDQEVYDAYLKQLTRQLGEPYGSVLPNGKTGPLLKAWVVGDTLAAIYKNGFAYQYNSEKIDQALREKALKDLHFYF